MRFTGWADVPLTAQGLQEARAAGETLASLKIVPDIVCTSLLTRAINSFEEVEKAFSFKHQNQMTIIKTWRLNERHYGGLVGLSKEQLVADHGVEKTTAWRKSWTIKPPHGPLMHFEHANPYCHQPLTTIDDRRSTLRYSFEEKFITMPSTESLEDCTMRMLPFWQQYVEPKIAANRTILVVAHANSIRGLIKHIDYRTLTPKNLQKLKIPPGAPLMYTFGLREHDGTLFTMGENKTGIEDPDGAQDRLSKIDQLNVKTQALGVTGTFLEESRGE